MNADPAARRNRRGVYVRTGRVVKDAQRTDHAGLHGMQAAQLYDDKNKTQYAGAPGDPEVLSF
jgi:hypothetical protein